MSQSSGVQYVTTGDGEVKTMGDGFMASFGSVSPALECAIGMQRALVAYNAAAEMPINVRIGLNTGSLSKKAG
jgi:class 3 adenylate cyclase